MAAILPTDLDVLEEHEIPQEFDRKAVLAFIAKTRDAQGAELANAQTVFRLLCDVLKVDPPALKKAGADNPYCFEADVKDGKDSRRMDAYKRGHLIFEAKQGIDPAGLGGHTALAHTKVGHSKNPKGAGVRGTRDWRDKMSSGRIQVGRYAAAVTRRGDPKPPFILLADLGHRLWIWSSFAPDATDDYGDFDEVAGFAWEQLAEPRVFRFLRLIFTAPRDLDEEAAGQRITAAIAADISRLAVALEKREKPDVVGDFLMRCVFTMFAEDVGLLPKRLFIDRVEKWIADKKSGKQDTFVRGLRALWKRMDAGGDLDSGERLRQFNGYLFKNCEPIDLTIPELEILHAAARANWRRVSPAIFGTLLERALSKEERHRLGAHYTPEPYIRRLVDRTIIAPLRAEWDLVRAKMRDATTKSKSPAEGKKKARTLGADFRTKLASIRVLDPACGSGNFLFVALKELKRLEGEVERTLIAIGGYQAPMDYEGSSVHPVQFFGIEVKPWAAKIAELVLWIGYLQWQTSAGRLHRMADPLIKDLHHIEARDALISWGKRTKLLDEDGQPVLRAVGVTDKKAERRMVEVERLTNVKVAPWPEVDFIVGNPPFLGNKRMMDVFGPGYVDAIKGAFPDVPGSADFVMWWWWRAAELVANGKLRAFGLVTTNSITQTFNRTIVAEAMEKKGLRVAYAIADHPWYDEGAAVRIAMSVAAKAPTAALIGAVVDERKTRSAELDLVRVDEHRAEAIHADLSTGAQVLSAVPLKANDGLSFQGITLVGEGFRLERDEVVALGYRPESLPSVLRRYLIGRDIVQRPIERYVIDFDGLTEANARGSHPALFEHVVTKVKPQRDAQNDRQRKEKWWLFGRSGADLRRALGNLDTYIATCRTSKHRLFVQVPTSVLPDTKLVAIALPGPEFLSILSSRVHVAWAMSTGGFLGVGNDSTYNHLDCFGRFPFPVLSDGARARLRALGDSLQQHREARQRESPDLALTDMYNVLEKVARGEKLGTDDEGVATKSLVHTLLDLHRQIDRAVLEAYGWPTDISDEEILTKLVALNAERAKEEAQGIVRWLRPEFQAPQAGTAATLPGAEATPAKAKPAKASTKQSDESVKWPADLPSRIGAVIAALRALEGEATTSELGARFKGAKEEDLAHVLSCVLASERIARVEDEHGERWLLSAAAAV